jgi:proline iminopeptidase
MKRLFAQFLLGLVLLGTAGAATAADHQGPGKGYFDHAGYDDVLSGGVKMIPVTTPDGTFHVWTKRVGNNPKLKVLLLHGGPGATHAYFEAFDSYFPGAGIQYYYYDQLGAGHSDRPTDTKLWTIDRYVDEVEQVRKALHLDRSNFCVLGHSWGGILAIEYALKYPQHLKCLVVSNMMASIPAYNAYARKVLEPAMDPAKLALVKQLEAEHRTDDPRYMQTLIPMHYEKHILRMPYAQWPEPVKRAFADINEQIYVLMQGPSELGASGRLEHWDRFDDLHRIEVPTLVIAGRYDTMDPAYMKAMSEQFPHGQYLLCPQGSHMDMYDDQATYFRGLIHFLKGVETGKQPAGA